MKYLTLFTFLVVLTQLFGQGGTSCYLSSALVMDHKITITHITADSLPCGVSGKYPLKKRRNYTFFYYNDRRVYLDMKKADDEMLTVLIQNYEPPEFPGYMPSAHMAFLLDSNGVIMERGIAWGSDDDEFTKQIVSKARAADFHFTPFMVHGKPVSSLQIVLLTLSDLRAFKALHR
jgi:hypothetical protein